MHIHKINPNSQEHQSFLAQNKKDPITGDSISEGDEVVFCAGCKSVFLRDTWEYLGEEHCEQYKTLIEFPSTIIKINLTSKEDILFYDFLPLKKNEINNVPHTVNSKLWKKKKGKLSNYNYFFHKSPLFLVLVLLSFIVAYIFYSMISSLLPFLGSLIFLIIIYFIGEIEQNIQGKKLDSVHNEFSDDVFYISKKGIGFSKKFGTKEFLLGSDCIHSLKFYFSSFYEDNFCVIQDKSGEITKFAVMNPLKEDNETIFLKALSMLTDNFSIYLKVYSDYTAYNKLEFIIKNNNYKINIYKK